MEDFLIHIALNSFKDLAELNILFKNNGTFSPIFSSSKSRSILATYGHGREKYNVSYVNF